MGQQRRRLLTCQCAGRRKGEETRSRERASHTPHLTMDLASEWTNTLPRASSSHDTCSTLSPAHSPVTS